MRGLATRFSQRAVAIAVLAGALAATLGGCGGASHADRVTTANSYAYFSLRAPHVLSGYTTYTLAAGRQPSSPRFAPVSAGSLREPIDAYRAYAVAQLHGMQPQLSALRRAIARGDRPAAESAWRDAYARYLRLGAVYLTGEVAALNRQIDGTSGGLAGGAANTSFVGLHRIEYGLWTGAPMGSLVRVAEALESSVSRLTRLLPRVRVTPLEYVTRAHEILEDAQRDLLSGSDVPWSGEGVLGTAAGLAATEEVVSTLRPLLGGREQVTPAVEVELASLRRALATIAAAHGGRLPSNRRLSRAQAELLDGTLGGALEALSAIPETLETEAPARYAPIPARDARIDP